MPRTRKFNVESVADVRRMGTCIYCKRAGLRGDGLIEVGCDRSPSGRVVSRELAHPKCYINAFGVMRLLTHIPIKELGTIRLGDVHKKTIDAILHRIALAGGR